QLVFQLDTAQLESGIQDLSVKYPVFASLYFKELLGLSNSEDSTIAGLVPGLRDFLSDSLNRTLYQLAEQAYPPGKALSDELLLSLKRLKYYFPQEREPIFYTLISGFSYGNFIFSDADGRDGIGIGLDFFLGEDFDYKKLDPRNPVFSEYLTRTFNRDHLQKKTWEAWVDDRLPEPASGQFLDYMIHRGKKLYLLSKILPEIPDSVLFEYTPAQLEWCQTNRVEMWSFFLSKNLLYSTELLKFNKYINPSPNAPGMPAEAPGRTGSYIGYCIVDAYMKKHPGTRLEELFKAGSGQEYLKASGFKPRND
ncbi:MAG TPA: hypothetical protein VFX48_10150, partial [Saprospiraceae bacterium]|nr:hypothetical protein [Saprospiraceae bacterium]